MNSPGYEQRWIAPIMRDDAASKSLDRKGNYPSHREGDASEIPCCIREVSEFIVPILFTGLANGRSIVWPDGCAGV